MQILELSKEKPVMALPWLGFSLCAVAYLSGGTASTLMATYLPVAVPQLLGEQAAEARLSELSAWIGAAFLYGWMAGGLAFGPVADRLGRVRTLVLATGLCGLAMLATAFVPGVPALLLARLLTGAGVGGILLVSTVYLAEVWPAPSRPVALGVLSTLFPVGIVTTGALVGGLADWRVAFGVGVIPW